MTALVVGEALKSGVQLEPLGTGAVGRDEVDVAEGVNFVRDVEVEMNVGVTVGAPVAVAVGSTGVSVGTGV